MIKLKQVTMVKGETSLVFEASFPDDSIREVAVPLSVVVDRLREVRRLLGVQVTLTDARNTIIALVNEMRRGHDPFAERFDFSQIIGVDLEEAS